MVIWKIPFPLDNRVGLQMPSGSRILSAQMQGHTACIWAFVDPAAAPRTMTLRNYRTGEACESPVDGYIATLQDPYGFVWHIFEDSR